MWCDLRDAVAFKPKCYMAKSLRSPGGKRNMADKPRCLDSPASKFMFARYHSSKFHSTVKFQNA